MAGGESLSAVAPLCATVHISASPSGQSHRGGLIVRSSCLHQQVRHRGHR